MTQVRRFSRSSPSSRKARLRSTMTAAQGSTSSKSFSMTPSSTAMEAVAPRELPTMAAKTVGTARRQFTSPRRMNFTVARVVPQEPESLLVAMALCTGRPASR